MLHPSSNDHFTLTPSHDKGILLSQQWQTVLPSIPRERHHVYISLYVITNGLVSVTVTYLLLLLISKLNFMLGK